jgi:hypothetical protein
MLTCPLSRSTMAKAKRLAILAGTLSAFGQTGLAQTPVGNIPIQLVAPAVPTYQIPAANAVVAQPVAIQPQVTTAAPVYYVPAQRAAAPRRSGPPSMSRSQFHERWRADLKVSGRGFRP